MANAALLTNTLWLTGQPTSVTRSSGRLVPTALSEHPTPGVATPSTTEGTPLKPANAEPNEEKRVSEAISQLSTAINQEFQWLYNNYNELTLAGRLQRLQVAYVNFGSLLTQVENDSLPDDVKRHWVKQLTSAQTVVVSFGATTLPGGLTPHEMKALLSPQDAKGNKDAHFDAAREKINRAAKQELVKRRNELAAASQSNNQAYHNAQQHDAQHSLAELNGLLMLSGQFGDNFTDPVGLTMGTTPANP
jgi:hypothetical protein